MCANYLVILAQNELADRYGVEASTHLDAVELFPKRTAPVVVSGPAGRTLHSMRWGLIPFWAQDDTAQPQPFNARGETVASSPMFRDAFKGRRCLMPASAFFEWKGEKGSKMRYQFTLPNDEPFAFAGIYNRRGESESCCLITTTPNGFMADFHNRMPVILDPRDYAAWLEPMAKVKDLKALLLPWAGRKRRGENRRYE